MLKWGLCSVNMLTTKITRDPLESLCQCCIFKFKMPPVLSHASRNLRDAG